MEMGVKWSIYRSIDHVQVSHRFSSFSPRFSTINFPESIGHLLFLAAFPVLTEDSSPVIYWAAWKYQVHNAIGWNVRVSAAKAAFNLNFFPSLALSLSLFLSFARFPDEISLVLSRFYLTLSTTTGTGIYGVVSVREINEDDYTALCSGKKHFEFFSCQTKYQH